MFLPKTFLAFLGVVGLSLASNITVEDYFPSVPFNVTIESRIHGGSLTGRAIPSVAALVERPEPNAIVQRCTATYLGDVWALTAAHCVQGLHVGPRSNTQLYLGTYDARKPAVIATVIDAIPAPRWRGQSMYGEDIALLRFDKKPNSPNIKPVCLSGGRQLDGVPLTAMGWGRTSCPGEPSWELKQSQGVGVSTDKCQGQYFGDLKTKLCAKFNPNGMVDKGDSGGPLFYKSTMGKLVQVGVLSRFVTDLRYPGHGCPDASDPAEYTRVSEFIPWIKTKYPKVCVDGGGGGFSLGLGKQNKPSSANKPKPSKPSKPGGSKCSGLFGCFPGKKQQKPGGGKKVHPAPPQPTGYGRHPPSYYYRS